MSSCRSTSFYLAPGVMRYFRDHTLVAVLPDGSWIEITHRNDVARLTAMYPGWDGTVLCGPKGDVRSVREALLNDPSRVERWVLDERIVEGRRPLGVEHPLHRLRHGGIEAVGGVTQAVQALLPGANKTLRQAAARLLEEYGEHASHRLSLACALRGIVPDDVIANALSTPALLDAAGWAPANVARMREDFLIATARWPERREALGRALLLGDGRSQVETLSLIRGVSSLSADVQRHILREGDETIRNALCDRRDLAQDVIIALSETLPPESREKLLGNPSTPPELVEEILRGASGRLSGGDSLNEALGDDDDFRAEVLRTSLLTKSSGNPYAEQAVLRTFFRLGESAGHDGFRYSDTFTIANSELTPETQQWLLDVLLPGAQRVGAARPEAVRALSENAFLPSATREAVRSLGPIEILTSNASLDPGLAREIYERALSLPDSHAARVLTLLAQEAPLDPSLQRELLVSDNPTILRHLAKNGGLAEETRLGLLRSGHLGEDERIGLVLQNPIGSEEARFVVETWGVEDQLEIAQRGWRNPGGRTPLMEELASSPHEIVRGALANNSSTGREVLERLVHDENVMVRATARQSLRKLDEYEQRMAQYLGETETDNQDDIHNVVDSLRAGRANIEHPSERELRGAAVMAQRGTDDVGPSGPPRTIAELPGFGALPFVGIQAARDVIDGSPFQVPVRDLEAGADTRETRDGATEATLELVARVLDSAQQIEKNAEYMGNCTAGYIDSVARGSVRLVGLYDADGRCHANIELTSQRGPWEPGEINTRFNGYGYGYHNTPESMREVAEQLAAQMSTVNNQRQQAPRAVPEVDEWF